MEGFEAPTRLDEFPGQSVEELRVRGKAAVGSKIIGVFDDSGAEVMAPNTIDDNAGEDWVTGVGDPFGEAPASVSFRRVGGKLEIRIR